MHHLLEIIKFSNCCYSGQGKEATSNVLITFIGDATLFLKIAHSRSLFLYFRLFCILIVQVVDEILPLIRFEVRISGVGSDCSTN